MSLTNEVICNKSYLRVNINVILLKRIRHNLKRLPITYTFSWWEYMRSLYLTTSVGSYKKRVIVICYYQKFRLISNFRHFDYLIVLLQNNKTYVKDLIALLLCNLTFKSLNVGAFIKIKKKRFVQRRICRKWIDVNVC